MEDKYMQAPQGRMMPPEPEAEMGGEMEGEEMAKQAIMARATEIMDEWKETGQINGEKITKEKDAWRTAVSMAMQEIEQEGQMAQREQMAQQAPPQGGGMMPPQGGGGPMMM